MDKASIVKTATRVAIALVALVLVYDSVFTVDQTQLANVRRFGVVLYPASNPLRPGLHFKIPLIDTADRLTVTMQTLHIPEFKVLTVDNQQVAIEENFNYTISPDKFYHIMYEVGRPGDVDIDNQVIPVAHDRTARIFASQNMVTVNQNREVIQKQVEESVAEAVEKLFGITAHSLQLAAIKPSDEFMRSIDQATMAKNEAIAAENQLRTKQFMADQEVATATGHANAVKVAADGEAYATEANAKADADAIRVKSDALKVSPNYVQFVIASRWNGTLPTTMLPNGATPLLDLKMTPDK